MGGGEGVEMRAEEGEPTSVSSSGQRLSLRWNDYSTNLLDSFRDLRDSGHFVDVTLATEDGRTAGAHKLVLSASSPFFRNILKDHPSFDHPIVILKDVRHRDLDSLLNFMYRGVVQIDQEDLNPFLRTAQALQVRGLTDHEPQRPSPPPSQSCPSSPLQPDLIPEVSLREGSSPTPGAAEEVNHTPAASSQSSNNTTNEAIRSNNDRTSTKTSILIQALEQGRRRQSFDAVDENRPEDRFNGTPPRGDEDMLSSDEEENEMKMEDGVLDSSADELSGHSTLTDSLRFPASAAALLHHGFHGLSGFHGGGNGSSLTVGSSPNNNPDNHFVSRSHHRSLELLRVRATDPRPCPKCGKIYRSAHTLRTHLEDKHTTCPGYRCVLCGTVAKSRNSLHSHMSRQHRGISTKDLPVLPMPSPFDPVLAARLLNKAGVKYGAQPGTGNENNSENAGAGSSSTSGGRGRSSEATDHKGKGGGDMGGAPLDASTTGSAILDTYLQFIAENSLALSSLHHYAHSGGRPVVNSPPASGMEGSDDEESGPAVGEV